MIMNEMSYFCRQNVSQISLEIVAICSHPSEILALEYFLYGINLDVLLLIFGLEVAQFVA